jgi:hypothetical protein
MDTANYRTRVLQPIADDLGDSQAELSDAPADHRHEGTEAGIGEGYPVTPAALAG